MIKAFVALIAFVACFCSEIQAAPVPGDTRIDVDFRRTTLFVHDLDASLALYRDAIGMEVMFDNKPGGAESNQPEGGDGASPRFVFLRSNDDFVGILALYQADASEGPPDLETIETGRPGGIALLFNTDELDVKFERAKASPKVRVIRPPTKMDYGSSDDGSEIVVFSSVLLDPDGHMIELNHVGPSP